jgi:tRNA (guanine9-N1)-methyltransferase
MDPTELVDPPQSNGSTELEASSSNPPTQLSKNAQKKAAKAARYAAQKLERRAKEKEAKKEKKRIKAEKRAAGELEEDEAQVEEEKRRAMKRAKTGTGQKTFEATVCVDLGFDDMMTDKVVGVVVCIARYSYVRTGNYIIMLTIGIYV